MAQHNDFGKKGEKLAAEFLEKNGYEILHTNWISGKNEIDIIAKTPELLVIVEVKSRSTRKFSAPEAAVTDAKIRRLTQAAEDFLRENDVDLPVRFDVISVVSAGENAEIQHIEDAFFPLLD